MSYRRQKHPPRRELPIAHNILVHVKADGLVTLIFEDDANVQASITLEQTIIITRPGEESLSLDATKPGLSFNPLGLQPLTVLCSKRIQHAFAYSNGRLLISLEDATELTVIPEQYEAWHFQRPAPFSPNKNTQEQISLTGTDGGLL